VVADRVSAAIVIGESGPEIGRQLARAGLARIDAADTMNEAVERADAVAREQLAAAVRATPPPIATVLLSPAAASFDMFEDYAARGRAFRAAVEQVAARRGGRS
jgi:UDP-N-acetylmuramoylalanine--D-glutamate ligase